MVKAFLAASAAEDKVGAAIAKTVIELVRDADPCDQVVVGLKPLMGQKLEPGSWQPLVFGEWWQVIPLISSQMHLPSLIEWTEEWDRLWSSRSRPMLPLLNQHFVVFVVDEELFDDFYDRKMVAGVDNRLYWIVQNAIWMKE